MILKRKELTRKRGIITISKKILSTEKISCSTTYLFALGVNLLINYVVVKTYHGEKLTCQKFPKGKDLTTLVLVRHNNGGRGEELTNQNFSLGKYLTSYEVSFFSFQA